MISNKTTHLPALTGRDGNFPKGEMTESEFDFIEKTF